MPTNAETYFKQIVEATDPVAFLNDQANDVFETEWLDFKGEPQPKDALKIWAEAVSGFSNTEGGVVVWGIDARYDQDRKLDVSNGLRLISNVQQFESLLRSNVVNLTTPPTQGIQIKSFETDSTGKGFVICLIPEGRSKPYRAEIGDRYYSIRSGSSFRDANPALLRAMFYPKASPDLQVIVRCDWDQNRLSVNHPHTSRPFTFKVILSNVGVLSAENIYIFCTALGRADSSWKSADARFTSVRRGEWEAAFWFPHYLNPSQT